MDLKLLKKHDYIKNKYCKCNNIHLIRLPWYGEVKNKDSLLNNLNRELKLLNIIF